MALDRRQARLATVGQHGGPRVGRYAVHLAEFESLALPEPEPSPQIGLLVVDEIGKMECLSPAFVEAARRTLAAPAPLLGAVALAGGLHRGGEARPGRRCASALRARSS